MQYFALKTCPYANNQDISTQLIVGSFIQPEVPRSRLTGNSLILNIVFSGNVIWPARDDNEFLICSLSPFQDVAPFKLKEEVLFDEASLSNANKFSVAMDADTTVSLVMIFPKRLEELGVLNGV